MNEHSDLITYRVRLLVAIATLAGLPLRVWPVGRLGLNQFDEGIYALVAHGISRDPGWFAIDPILISYAPPGYPLLVSLLSLVVGMGDQTCLLTSALAGTLTIPLAAWIAAEVFGERAAVTTAWLICLAGPHIAFSRMGLTDATFLCCWSMAWLACHRFLRSPVFGNALLMGGLVGLAQEIKYNGWLIGGFALMTAGVGPIVSRADWSLKRWIRLAGWGTLAILLAWLVVLPWYQFVEAHGGYTALLRHQRSYLGGVARWWPHLRSQVHQASMFSGTISFQAATVGVVVWSLWVIQPGKPERIWRSGIRLLAVAGLISPLINNPLVAGVIGLTFLDVRARLADRLLGVIWVGLFILTPCYHPYARLWLPFELASWVVLGGLTVRWVDQLGELSTIRQLPVGCRLRFAVAGLILVGTCWFGPGFPNGSATTLSHDGLFAASDSLSLAAPHVRSRLGPEVQQLRTLVRPSMLYSLSGSIQLSPQSDFSQFQRIGDSRAWGLIDSTLLAPILTTSIDPEPRRLIEPLLDRWIIVSEFRTGTSLPTSLDLDPARRDTSPTHSLSCFWLIRPRRDTD